MISYQKIPTDSKSTIPDNLQMIKEIQEIAEKEPNLSDNEVYLRLEKIYKIFPHVGIQAMDQYRKTPLMFAAELGLPSVIKALFKLTKYNLMKSPELPHFDSLNCTALEYSIYGKNSGDNDKKIQQRKEAIDLLLDKKSSIYAADYSTIKPKLSLLLAFRRACQLGNIHFIKKFKELYCDKYFPNLSHMRLFPAEAIIANLENNRGYYLGFAAMNCSEILPFLFNFFDVDLNHQGNFGFLYNVLETIGAYRDEQGFKNLLTAGITLESIENSYSCNYNNSTSPKDLFIKAYIDNQKKSISDAKQNITSSVSMPTASAPPIKDSSSPITANATTDSKTVTVTNNHSVLFSQSAAAEASNESKTNYAEKLKNLLTMLESAEKSGNSELVLGTYKLIGPQLEALGALIKASSVELSQSSLAPA